MSILLQSVVKTVTLAKLLFSSIGEIRYQISKVASNLQYINQNKPATETNSVPFQRWLHWALQVHQHVPLRPTNFLTLLNTRPLKINNANSIWVQKGSVAIFITLANSLGKSERITRHWEKRILSLQICIWPLKESRIQGSSESRRKAAGPRDTHVCPDLVLCQCPPWSRHYRSLLE